MKNTKINPFRNMLVWIVVILIIASVYSFITQGVSETKQLTYDAFIEEVQRDNVAVINGQVSTTGEIYEITGRLRSQGENDMYFVTVPATNGINTVIDIAAANGAEVDFTAASGVSFLTVILNFLPILLMVGVLFFFLSRQSGSAGKAMEFGKSRAKLYSNDKKITYSDVAGLEEEKEELKEIVDFLKSPKKFQKMGARIPKGLLLVGPPGTGKTLLAKAVAGEAGVPFFTISGSDFVEMFVGVGAGRVRDMFKKAKQSAPCLLFIDEIDAVGRQRGAGMGGGNDEREQTLNQLLVEMDGFDENAGIILIAATNRPDVLDPALLRPGRFDRQVQVDNPDKKARIEILKVHARNKKFAEEVDFDLVAQRTPGFSGADLENLLNESALLTVREDLKEIPMSLIDEAADRVMMGPAKKSRKYTDEERNMVAHHEAGHVVIGLKLKNASDVHKVTIIPRGRAGGYALMLPQEETYTSSKSELLERITGYLGGRVSEELIFNEITTGAGSDIESSTKIARAMVCEFGMSDLGPVQLEKRDGNVFLGRDYSKNKTYSDDVALAIDKEIRKIIDGCYDQAKAILEENMDLLKAIAKNLLKFDTLNKEQILYIEEHGDLPESGNVLAKEKTKLETKDLVEEVIKEFEEAEEA
jgi:cell division protease FtsH